MQQQNSGTTTTKMPDMKNQQFERQGTYPVTDEVYDLITTLANELQGLEKFQQYAQDGKGGKFWQDAVTLKRQLAELFTHELGEHAKEGALGTGEHRFQK